MERVSTGVEKLDKLLYGGVPKGFVVAVVGSSGTGKSILCSQFIWEGALKGERGLYIQLEGRIETVFEQAREFGWDFENNPDIQVIKYDPERIADFMKDLKDIVDRDGVKRLVIDSISLYDTYLKSELAHAKADDSPQSRNRLVIDEIRKLDVTTLAIVEEYEKMLVEDEVIEFASDGTIRLKKTSVGKETIRALVIEKMRLTDINPTTQRFKLMEEGIRIE